MNEINNFIEPVKAFYEGILDGIIVTNLSGKVSYINLSACNLLKCGYKSDLKNHHIDQIFPEPKYVSEIMHRLSTHRSFITKSKCLKKDGTVSEFEICFSSLTNLNSEPVGIQIVFKNPNIIANAQEYLENKSSLLNSLNYQTREIVLICDLQLKKNVYCSQSVEKILGWTQKEFLDGGWPFVLALTHIEDAKNIGLNFNQEIGLRKREPFIHDHKPIIYNYRKRHKNGEWIHFHAENILLERDENQEIKYMISFLRDVTQEKAHSNTDGNSSDSKINKEIESLVTQGALKPKKNTVNLSKREKEILKLVRDGLSTKEIADILELKITSVNSYRKNLMVKMNAKNTAELVQKSNQISIT